MPATPCALLTGIGRKPDPRQSESRNPAQKGNRETLDTLGGDRLYEGRGGVSFPISTSIGTFPQGEGRMTNGTVDTILENGDHIASILAAIAVLATAVFSYNVIKRWRDEKRFDTRLKHAIRILKVVYTIRNDIDYIRFHKVPEEDRKKVIENLKSMNFSTHTIERLAIAQSVLNRIEAFSKNRDKIIDHLPEAQAVFGEKVKNALYDLRRIYFRIEIIAENIIRSGDNATEDEIGSLTINRDVDKADEIEIRVSRQIHIIEKECRPIVDPEKHERKKRVSDGKMLCLAVEMVSVR